MKDLESSHKGNRDATDGKRRSPPLAPANVLSGPKWCRMFRRGLGERRQFARLSLDEWRLLLETRTVIPPHVLNVTRHYGQGRLLS